MNRPSIRPEFARSGNIPTEAAGTANAASDGYVIRSEERLQVSTVPVRARRVRLEKYVVTETRTITVQVSHEEIRLVEIDLDDDRTDDSDVLSESDVTGRWLILSEERVAITTEVVPVERVRLAVYSVTEQQDVTDSVRREQIKFDPLQPAGHTRDATTEKDIR
jgi:uncharacterized protein (TIGR02271 family)